MDIPILLAELFPDQERWYAFAFFFFLIAALVWLFIWLLWMEDFGEGGDGSGTVEKESVTGESTIGEPSSSEPDSKAAGEVALEQAPEPIGQTPKGDNFQKLGLRSDSEQGFYVAGVSTYGQIADWKPEDVSKYKATYGAANPDVVFEDLPWRAHALAAGVDPDNLESDDPAFGRPHVAPASVDHQALITSDFSGEKVKNDEDLGVVYESDATPSHEDELSAIKGVGPKLSKDLNEFGVFCYKQIANWSDHNVAEFAERLNSFKGRIERDRWIPQAATLDCIGGEEEFSAATEEEAANLFSDEIASGLVRQDDIYGIVYEKAPDEIDDLKKIKGIAKVFEGKLHGIGVYRFKQIAVWTDAACAEFSKMMTFKNRIYTDNWLAQAKKFHEEKYDEKIG